MMCTYFFKQTYIKGGEYMNDIYVLIFVGLLFISLGYLLYRTNYIVTTCRYVARHYSINGHDYETARKRLAYLENQHENNYSKIKRVQHFLQKAEIQIDNHTHMIIVRIPNLTKNVYVYKYYHKGELMDSSVVTHHYGPQYYGEIPFKKPYRKDALKCFQTLYDTHNIQMKKEKQIQRQKAKLKQKTYKSYKRQTSQQK